MKAASDGGLFHGQAVCCPARRHIGIRKRCSAALQVDAISTARTTKAAIAGGLFHVRAGVR